MDINSKQDFINVLNAIIEPLRDELKKSVGAPSFGSTAAWYDDISTTAETFARPLWGLAPLWRGGYGDEEMKEIYRVGIINGTDPASDKYWGETGDCDQRYVEMAALAYAILLTPDVVWEPLTQGQKNNFKNWLRQINTHEVCDSNWRFFRVLVNIALKSVGEEYSQERLAEDLARFDDFYIGNGWYMDGPQHQKDYYVPMAIHFYGLIYSCFEEDEYSKKFRERAELFARSFIYWFADNGAALPYGRSLTYRFAQGAFWSACVMAGVKPFSDGVMKGIISRHIEYWMGAPMLDNGGALTVGYRYPNLIMAEHYNSPGSPNWGLKFFAMLALADDAPFWSAEAEPMPELAKTALIREADMLMTRTDGEVIAYPAGTHDNLCCGQLTSKYLKFAYSTKFGFNVKYSDLSISEACGDNMLVFDIGGVFCERRFNYSFELTEEHIVINWSPIKGIRVRTEVIPEEDGHIRKHRIESDFDCIAYDGGFAVANSDKDHCLTEARGNIASADSMSAGCSVKSENGTGIIVGAAVNTNVLYNKTVIPTIRYRVHKGINEFTTVVSTRYFEEIS
ncbi:MAG: DUF2264 domain-containing protein [Candidatus Ornithomonoglobus sp.]